MLGSGSGTAEQRQSALFMGGVLLASASSFLVCLGLGVQKVSLCQAGHEDVSPWKQPKWLLGFLLMLAGNLVDFVAFGMAPQSLLAPLAALSLVFNLGVSHHLLKESYGRNDVVAVSLIFVGTATAVIFSSHEEREYPLETLRALYHQPRMYVYDVLMPAVVGAHYLLVKYAAENKPGGHWQLAELVGRTGVAGLVGGVSVLFAKSTVELLKDAAFGGQQVFSQPDTYLIILCMLLCLFAQITFLNGAMKRFDQLLVLPLYQSYWCLSGVVSGMVYFGEGASMSSTQINMFCLGTAITLSGLLVLAGKATRVLASAEAGFDVIGSPLSDGVASLDSMHSLGSVGFLSEGSGGSDCDVFEMELPTRRVFSQDVRVMSGDAGLGLLDVDADADVADDVVRIHSASTTDDLPGRRLRVGSFGAGNGSAGVGSASGSGAGVDDGDTDSARRRSFNSGAALAKA